MQYESRKFYFLKKTFVSLFTVTLIDSMHVRVLLDCIFGQNNMKKKKNHKKQLHSIKSSNVPIKLELNHHDFYERHYIWLEFNVANPAIKIKISFFPDSVCNHYVH